MTTPDPTPNPNPHPHTIQVPLWSLPYLINGPSFIDPDLLQESQTIEFLLQNDYGPHFILSIDPSQDPYFTWTLSRYVHTSGTVVDVQIIPQGAPS